MLDRGDTLVAGLGSGAPGTAMAWPTPGADPGFQPKLERRIVEKQGGGLAPMQEAAE